MKKLFLFLLASLSILISVVFISSPAKEIEVSNDTEIAQAIVSNTNLNSSEEKLKKFNSTENNTDISENIIYTATLEHIEPIKEGDEYSWMLTSEPGQLSIRFRY